MIEYLKRLIRDQNWREALSYAEQLTVNEQLDMVNLVVVYRSILKARLKIGEHEGALAVGEIAVRLAKEAEDWDSYGMACNDVGVAHFMLKEYEEAVSFFREYLAQVSRYTTALEIHMLVWYNLGCIYLAMGRGSDAVAALTEALDLARRSGDAESIHGLRLVLVDARLKSGRLEQVPRLLAQSACYLRTRSTNQPQILYLLTYRVKFALQTGRVQRAQMLAIKGLLFSRDDFRFQCHFHLLLAKVEEARCALSEALNHALSARAYSVRCQRPDLETEVSTAIKRLTESGIA